MSASTERLLRCLLLAVFVVPAGLAAAKDARETPKEKQPARTDRHGDPLPEGALARLGTVRWRAAGEIRTLAFAPDGKSLAAASSRQLFFFDDTGRLTRSIHPPETTFSRIAFSPRGKRLLCHCTVIVDRRLRRMVQIWEPATGRKLREFPVENVQWIGWSPDGEPLAVLLEQKAVVLRQLATGKERRFEAENLPMPGHGLTGRDYLAAENLLAFADSGETIHLFDTSTGKKQRTIETKGAYTWSLAFSPNGRWLATLSQLANDKRGARIYEVATGKLVHTLAADQNNLFAASFSPDGKTLATFNWTEVRFHDAATGKERGRTKDESHLAATSAWTPDSKTFVTAEYDGSAIHRLDVATATRKPAPAGHHTSPVGIAFSADGQRVATGGMDRAIFVWNRKGEALRRIPVKGWVRSCAFSAYGKTLFADTSGETLSFFDVTTGALRHEVKLDNPDQPDAKQSGLDMVLSVDRKSLAALSIAYPRKAGLRVDQKLLLTGWDVATRKQLFRRTRRRIDFGWAISPDLKLLAMAQGEDDLTMLKGPGNDPLRIEDLATGERVLILPKVEGQTRPLAFSPDSRLLASNTFGPVPGAKNPALEKTHTLRVWELATSSEILAHPGVINARVAFSGNRRLLALTPTAQEIVLWDLWQGKEVRRIKGFGADVTCLAFSPDDQQLLSGHANSTLLVWDVTAQNAVKLVPVDVKGAAKAWETLGGDARKAFTARWALVESAHSLPLLQKHLKPVAQPDGKHLRRLLADLDSDQFAVREKARKDLETLGDQAAGALHQKLKEKPSLEVHRRIQVLLDRLRGPITQPDLLRAVRSVAVLEDIGTPEARKILEALARSAQARLTTEATAALRRMQRPR